MTTIAVIGASTNREKYGNRCVRAYLSKGYFVVPINPHENQIEGQKAYRSVLDFPEKIDLASLYLQPEIGVKVLPELKQKGILDFYVNPGAESDELVAEAGKLGLKPRLTCSIRAIGLDPEKL